MYLYTFIVQQGIPLTFFECGFSYSGSVLLCMMMCYGLGLAELSFMLSLYFQTLLMNSVP